MEKDGSWFEKKHFVEDVGLAVRAEWAAAHVRADHRLAVDLRSAAPIHE